MSFNNDSHSKPYYGYVARYSPTQSSACTRARSFSTVAVAVVSSLLSCSPALSFSIPDIAGSRRIPTPQSLQQDPSTLKSRHIRNITPAKPRRQIWGKWAGSPKASLARDICCRESTRFEAYARPTAAFSCGFHLLEGVPPMGGATVKPNRSLFPDEQAVTRPCKLVVTFSLSDCPKCMGLVRRYLGVRLEERLEWNVARRAAIVQGPKRAGAAGGRTE